MNKLIIRLRDCCRADWPVRREPISGWRKVLPAGRWHRGRLVGRGHHPRGLNHLWQAGLSEDETGELGVLGADVPVFVRGRSPSRRGRGEAGCTGRGAGCLVPGTKPDCHVATAAVFQDPDLPRNTPKMTLDNLLAGEWKNDCELLVKSATPGCQCARLVRIRAVKNDGHWRLRLCSI